jgi:hypothetical protein
MKLQLLLVNYMQACLELVIHTKKLPSTISAAGTESIAKPVVTQATPTTSTNKAAFIFFIYSPLLLNSLVKSWRVF